MTMLEATRGDDETYELTILAADQQPVNLTGAQLWFTAKRSHHHSDAEAIIRKTIGAGITVVDAAAGRADVKVDAADTAGLPADQLQLVWDCQLKDASGQVSTVDSGRLVIVPDVTVATA